MENGPKADKKGGKLAAKIENGPWPEKVDKMAQKRSPKWPKRGGQWDVGSFVHIFLPFLGHFVPHFGPRAMSSFPANF